MRTTRLALSLLAAPLGACTAARMELDPKLATSAPEQPVRGAAWAQFRKSVTFGAYTAKLTKGGFTTTSSTRAGPYERDTTRQAFEFVMQGGTPASWQGACSYGTSRQAVLFPIKDDAGFVCTLIPEGAPGWQLHLASQGKLYQVNTLSGTLTDGTTTFSVAMVHRLQRASFASASPVGYQLRDAGGAAVAAVQTLQPQTIWVDPALPIEHQTAIAAAAVGLLVSSGAASSINSAK